MALNCKNRNNLVLLFFLMFFGFHARSQSISLTENLLQFGLATVDLNDVVSGGGIHDMLTRRNVPLQSVPISLYSSRQRQLQHFINNELGESVIAYTPVSDTSEWTSIDKEDITPFTWRWIELQQIHSNNDTSFISLRRPLSWLKEAGANQIGDLVSLDLQEMGIQGLATVTDIRLNQLDTRISNDEDENGVVTGPPLTGWSMTNDHHECVSRPITGKFIHKSHDVYDLYFNNQQAPVSVTGNHPFWSVDRNTWISAAALQTGEKVKAFKADCVVSNRLKKNGNHQVYNLEVYRTHNYYVSSGKFLVHNVCILEFLKLSSEKMILGKRHIVMGEKFEKLVLSNKSNHGFFRMDYGVSVGWRIGDTNGMIIEAMDKIVDRDGVMLMFLDDVDIAAAKKGFNSFDDAVIGNITEWELSIILRNRRYYDNTVVNLNGEVVPISQVEGLEYCGPK